MSIYHSSLLFSKAYGKSIYLKPKSKWSGGSQEVTLVTQVKTVDTLPPNWHKKRRKRNVANSAYGTTESSHKLDETKLHGSKSGSPSRDEAPLRPEMGPKSTPSNVLPQKPLKKIMRAIELNGKQKEKKAEVEKSKGVAPQETPVERVEKKRGKKGVKVIRSTRAVNPFEVLARTIKIDT